MLWLLLRVGGLKEETGLQHCFCLNLLSLCARKYGNISFVGKCLYPIEQKATSIIMLCNLQSKAIIYPENGYRTGLEGRRPLSAKANGSLGIGIAGRIPVAYG